MVNIDNLPQCILNKSNEILVNEELSKIYEWLNINKLLLNKSKSKYMVFHMPNKCMQTLMLKLDDVCIERLAELNVL